MATEKPRQTIENKARKRLGRSQSVPEPRHRLARAIREGIAAGEDNARLADEVKQIGLSAEI